MRGDSQHGQRGNAATLGPRVRAGVRSRSRITLFAAIALLLIAVSLGSRVWPPLISNVEGAVRFEVILAEDKAAPGLREAKVSGSNRSVYLHDEVIVDNGDIATARVVQSGDPPRYTVEVTFKASGAEKMRTATGNHIGKPMAILIDGQVVMAPVIRSPIGASALVTGKFTRAQAERIVNGIGVQ
jgi:hypothetical protein